MDENILFYTQKIDDDLLNNNLTEIERNEIANDLRKNLSKNSIVFAQINPVCGDIEANTQKAFKWIEWANRLGVGAIFFPELYLFGSPLGDYIDKFPHVVDEAKEWLEVLARKTKDTKVFIGYVERDNTNIGNMYYNSVAVLCNGKIAQNIRKSVFFDFMQFQDYNKFVSCPFNVEDRCVDVNSCNVGVLIGEEIAANSDYDTKFDVADLLCSNKKIDFVVNISSSISRLNKNVVQNEIMSCIAQKYNKKVLYVNQVGSAGTVLFDGGSSVYNENGALIYRAKSFDEQFFVVDLDKQRGKVYSSQSLLDSSTKLQDKFTLDYENELERIYLTVVNSIKDYFKKTGFKRAVLGLSGGLDSTVSAVLLADALGSENVFGISMPSKITTEESKNDAKKLAENLGINFTEVFIKDMCDNTTLKFNSVFEIVEDSWDCRYKESFTNDNIQARSRAMILWGVANEFQACLPIATSDKSELYMGYATINGDMSGGYAPLADVTKTKLFALARWLNKNGKIKNAIPDSIIEKRPGAELAINPKTGKPLLAEEALMPYEFMDEVIWRVENKGQTITDMLNEEFLYEKNLKSSGQILSCEQKREWLEKFFRRMSFALFKWTIMPSSPIVDFHSINSYEYRQPITSSKINYNKTSFDYKLLQINNKND